jgi:hypothetical protein
VTAKDLLTKVIQCSPAKIPTMSLRNPIAVASRPALRRTTVSLLAFFTLCGGLASAQTPKQASCVVEDIDTPTMPACVIQSRNGVLFISKKYWMHPAFNRYGLSPFTIDPLGASTPTDLGVSSFEMSA